MYVMAFKFLTIVSRHKMNEYAINIPKLNKLNNKQKKNKVFHMHLTSLKFFVLIPLNQKCYWSAQNYAGVRVKRLSVGKTKTGLVRGHLRHPYKKGS